MRAIYLIGDVAEIIEFGPMEAKQRSSEMMRRPDVSSNVLLATTPPLAVSAVTAKPASERSPGTSSAAARYVTEHVNANEESAPRSGRRSQRSGRRPFRRHRGCFWRPSVWDPCSLGGYSASHSHYALDAPEDSDVVLLAIAAQGDNEQPVMETIGSDAFCGSLNEGRQKDVAGAAQGDNE